jgi:predicted membrane protein
MSEELPSNGQPGASGSGGGSGNDPDERNRRRHQFRDHFRNQPDHNHPGHNHQDLFSARLVIGLIIVVIGLSLLADNLGLVSARYVLRNFWPLAMIVVGVIMLRNPTSDARRKRVAWVLIGVGAWIFADKIGWIQVSLWQLLVPGLFLFVGGMLIYRAFNGPPKEPEPGTGAPEDHAEYIRSFALMSGCELRPVSRPFRGADLNAVMGGIKLDLADARMEGDSAVIDAFAFWGAIEIFVPPDWTVTSKVTTLMGGFIDKRRPTSVVPTKTLIVRGVVVMSGIEVKN